MYEWFVSDIAEFIVALPKLYSWLKKFVQFDLTNHSEGYSFLVNHSRNFFRVFFNALSTADKWLHNFHASHWLLVFSR